MEEEIYLLTEENKKFNKSLEDQTAKISDLQDENERLTTVIADMQENLENQSKLIETQSKTFSEAIEELENKILILSSRPCACH